MRLPPWKPWAMATASTLIGATMLPLAMLAVSWWWEERDGEEGT